MVSHTTPREKSEANCEFLFIFNLPNREDIKEDRPASPRFSNDLNLVFFAHEALRLGFRCWFTFSDFRNDWSPPFEVTRVFPHVEMSQQVCESRDSNLIVMTASQHLLPHRSVSNAALQVLVEAAVHEVEVPASVDLFWARRYRETLLNADFIITQNPRMAELISLKCSLLTGEYRGCDIRIAPLGILHEDLERFNLRRSDSRIEARRTLGVDAQTKVIVNAGGVWDWTDFDTFLIAWSRLDEEVVEKLFLLLPGLGQNENRQHEPFHASIIQILDQMPTTHRNRVLLCHSWEEGSTRLPTFMDAADVGLNVNRAGVEAWQSHRLRSLEYLKFGIPVITTGTDTISGEYPQSSSFAVKSGCVEGYMSVLRQVAGLHEAELDSAALLLRSMAKSYSSTRTHSPLVSYLADKALESSVSLSRPRLGLRRLMAKTLRRIFKSKFSLHLIRNESIRTMARHWLSKSGVYR